MPQNELEIQFESLVFDDAAKTPAIETDEYVERSATLPDGSKWVFRDFKNPEHLAKETLYWDWVNRFFPKLILDRRTVYKMENDAKRVTGSCWKKYFIGEKKLLESDVKRLVDYNVPLAFAVLFFLNQSYSCVNTYFIDLADQYKINHFKLAEKDDEEVFCRNSLLIRGLDSHHKELLEFSSRKELEKFVNEYWLGLLHIALMPTTRWDGIFIEKQMKLRCYLKASRVFEIVSRLSSRELLTHIQSFCRQFTEFNSKTFFDYRNAIIKNYCFFLADLFGEKIKRAAEQFILNLEKSDRDDKRGFHDKIIKSNIGKIYLNIQAQLSSEPSLDYFVRCSSILTILSQMNDESREIVMLDVAFQRVSAIAVNTIQLKLVAIQDDEPLPIELDKFSQPVFAKQCIDWLRRTETNGLKDVLLNKNLLIYLYEHAEKNFMGAQLTSCPRFSFVTSAQPTLPEGVKLLYQKMIFENNPDQLCVYLFELMKIAPEDFWNLLLRQLAVVVFSEDVIMTIAKNVMSPENKYDAFRIISYIERLFSKVEVPREALLELKTHFNEALQAQIKENRDSQTSGFRMSGSGMILFSSGAAAAAASSQPDVSAPDRQAPAQPSWSEAIGSYLQLFSK